MKTEIKEIYKCEYCNKLYQIKSACENHELACRKNPANFRPCYSCFNLEKKEALIYSGYDDYYTYEPVNVPRDFFFCTKNQIFLYTPQNEIKGNFDHTDTEGGIFKNHPMPKKCRHYNSDLL